MTISASMPPKGMEVDAFRYLPKAELDRKLPGYFSDALAVCRTRQRKVEIFCEGESMPSLYRQSPMWKAKGTNSSCTWSAGLEKNLYARMTMLQLEELLLPQGFLRIHKQFLVNMAYLQSLQSTGRCSDNRKKFEGKCPKFTAKTSENLPLEGATDMVGVWGNIVWLDREYTCHIS